MYTTTRHGGLYLNRIQQMRDQVDNYDTILQETKTKQLDEQKQLNATQIFAVITERLNSKSVECRVDDSKGNSLLLADAILEAFDNEGFFVSTNYRRLLILPRLDQGNILTVNELDKIFQTFIDAINPMIGERSFTGIRGSELYKVFILRLTTN